MPFAAPEELVRCHLVLRKRDYAVARIDEVLEPSPLRVEPRCRYFGKCGGCQLQHISREGQLVAHKMIVSETLERVGKVFVPVRNVTGYGEPWCYRNKTQYPVAAGPHIGFFRPESHFVLDIEECLLHPPEFDGMRVAMLAAMKSAGESGYQERSNTGSIRHFVLRRALPGKDTLAVIVTATADLDAGLVEAVASQPNVTGVVQNINPDRTNRILGPRSRVRAGAGELWSHVLGKRLRVSAQSFFQVNSFQVEELCRKVLKHAAPQPDDTVLDLYSGVGMLSLVLADLSARVIGVELDRGSVDDARFNAAGCGADNVEFRQGDADAVIGAVERADVVVLDPPRKGCRPETLNAVTKLGPRRVVYVSCNPATLARDLAFLESAGYVTRDVEPVDMFSQTAHVEVIAHLTPAAA